MNDPTTTLPSPIHGTSPTRQGREMECMDAGKGERGKVPGDIGGVAGNVEGGNAGKTSKCRAPGCTNRFKQYQSFVSWCSPECGALIAAKKMGKIRRDEAVKGRRADKVTREKLKTRSDWLKEAKTAIQRFRRLDELAMGSGCMSCGRSQQEVQGTDAWKPGGAWDGGHYMSKGARPELALEPLNIWLQCKSCNAGSGKYARKGYTVNASFRINLIERIGLEQVEWLEGNHEAKHYDIDDLKAIKAKYAALTRELAV